jgi:hypothetical protein
MRTMTASLALLWTLATVSVGGAPATVTGLPPCETASPPPKVSAPAAPRNLRIIQRSGLEEYDFPSGPNIGESSSASSAGDALQQSAGTHDYYMELASRPDCVAAYSLRDRSQIEKYRRGKTRPTGVDYFWPNDPDPRRQDAAKVTIHDMKDSLATQLWLPLNHAPRTPLLATFDAWYGKEFDFNYAGIGNYKAWNFCSVGSTIWTEVRSRFQLGNNDPSVVAYTDIRQYRASQSHGPNTLPSGGKHGGRNYGGNAIGPISHEFGMAPERWTRFWLLLVPDGEWYRLSLWAADTEREAVQVYDGLQVRPGLKTKDGIIGSMDGTWDIFRVEYNTSQTAAWKGRGEMTAYFRNMVVLRASSVQGLLQRPVP